MIASSLPTIITFPRELPLDTQWLKFCTSIWGYEMHDVMPWREKGEEGVGLREREGEGERG
jgi:hypothetical protein